ncbi:hypothetical protein [Vibrio phage vB_ValS_PJ32]|nr:hypothetical protein [Vibrio phage vB_ValS_PJ32]
MKLITQMRDEFTSASNTLNVCANLVPKEHEKIKTDLTNAANIYAAMALDLSHYGISEVVMHHSKALDLLPKWVELAELGQTGHNVFNLLKEVKRLS